MKQINGGLLLLYMGISTLLGAMIFSVARLDANLGALVGITIGGIAGLFYA